MIYYVDRSKLSSYETEKLEEFKEFCRSNHLKIPEIDAEVLRFLHARGFDPQKTYDTIIAKYKARKDFFPLTVNEEVMKLLKSGFLYVAGRDKFFRPVLVMRPRIVI